MNNLLEIVAGSDGNYYFSNFGEAVVYALLGFAIVFAGIVIIIFIIWLVGLLMRKTNNFAFLGKLFKKKSKVNVLQESKDMVDADEIPDEVKAAIMAAIMAYYTNEQPKCEFKVKRIKRV